VVVAQGVEPTANSIRVEKLWREAWEEAGLLASTYANAQSHPRVAAWREAMAATGVSGRKYPSSVESLLRRAFKGGEPPRINPLVDFYNSISLRYVVPAGGFDLALLGDALELRLTREADTFRPLDSASAERVEPKEVAYASGNEILTRHFVWKQSHTGLLSESTRSVFLVSEVLGEVEESADGLAQAVLEDLCEGLRRHFGAEPVNFLVEQRVPAASW
jgi:DNA/RNA-binding domain of Phe-tRNA-synthetase-like protein